VTPLFPSRLEQIVFWGILILSLGWVGIWAARHSGREGTRTQQVPHQWAFAGIPLGIVIGYARIGVLPDRLFYPGEALVVTGFAFMFWSYSFLGRYVSSYVHVYPDHHVIEDGPYRYVRHPGYLGQIVAFIGLGLALQSWVALLVILVVAGSRIAYRIRIEEEFLSSELGDAYVDYMRRTKRLIPFVW
jgi:protein-S-isoprenylcysteine O-methyltransferase Ste14